MYSSFEIGLPWIRKKLQKFGVGQVCFRVDEGVELVHTCGGEVRRNKSAVRWDAGDSDDIEKSRGKRTRAKEKGIGERRPET